MSIPGLSHPVPETAVFCTFFLSSWGRPIPAWCHPGSVGRLHHVYMDITTCLGAHLRPMLAPMLHTWAQSGVLKLNGGASGLLCGAACWGAWCGLCWVWCVICRVRCCWAATYLGKCLRARRGALGKEALCIPSLFGAGRFCQPLVKTKRPMLPNPC